ncbi:MAG: glycine cleavage system protein H [Deltaproteobacteria bacterium]|nr:glycine cleavage system protein H [Deltaproteobacteria bacterium]
MENNKRCPFLKIQVCGYCSLFPLKKMIPVDQMKTKSMCLSGEYQQCTQYGEATSKGPAESPAYPVDVMEKDVKGFIIRKNYFYHYGHTWVKQDGENKVKIGIDGFASKLLSNIQHVQFISGTHILNGGKAFMHVQCGGKTGALISPVDGTIVAMNRSLGKDAGIVNREPYDSGWVLSAAVASRSMRWLLNDTLAVQWMEIEAERLHSIVRQDTGITMTDGGIMIESLASVVNEEEWKPLMRAFLLNE